MLSSVTGILLRALSVTGTKPPAASILSQMHSKGSIRRKGYGLLAPYASQVTVMPYRTPCIPRIVILKPLASTSVGSTENPNLSLSRLAPDSMPAIATETVGLVPNGCANSTGGDVQIVGPPRSKFCSAQSGESG